MVECASQSAEQTASLPRHVDPRCVVDFDYLNPTGFSPEGDVHEAWRMLHTGPDIIWTPRHGGHWIFTRAEDIAWAQEAYQIFSHREFVVPRAAAISLPPITLDPPDNLPYRAVLTPSFTPKMVRDTYQPKVRALTVELVERIKPKGACEFVADFASIMPVCIFLDIANLPVDRREDFLEWAGGMGRPAERASSIRLVTTYLAAAIQERGPGEDLLGRLAAALDDPRFETKSEVINMAMLIFAGGLDTVAALLSFVMRTAAIDEDLQDRLRNDPAVLAEAVDELLRRHGVSTSARLVTTGCEHKGVWLAPGDMVMLPSILAGLDDRRYADPMRIDFNRPTPPHSTFGNGPHRCVGQYLARMELQIFLEEWFRRMPNVRLDPAWPAITEAGAVSKLTRLNLLWT